MVLTVPGLTPGGACAVITSSGGLAASRLATSTPSAGWTGGELALVVFSVVIAATQGRQVLLRMVVDILMQDIYRRIARGGS
jgi:hypothetical protein